MNSATRRKQWVSALVVVTMIAALPGALYARGDRGLNQPGAVGNVGHAGPGRDPGVNQPGAVGNVGPAGPGRDPGVNQPGPAGNRRGIGR
jgi:hypothetical protein